MISVFSLVLSSLIIPQGHCGFQNTFLEALFCFFFFSLLSQMSKESSGGVYAT